MKDIVILLLEYKRHTNSDSVRQRDVEVLKKQFLNCLPKLEHEKVGTRVRWKDVISWSKDEDEIEEQEDRETKDTALPVWATLNEDRRMGAEQLTSRIRRQNFNGKENGVESRNVTCKYCKKREHIKGNCWKLNDGLSDSCNRRYFIPSEYDGGKAISPKSFLEMNKNKNSLSKVLRARSETDLRIIGKIGSGYTTDSPYLPYTKEQLSLGQVVKVLIPGEGVALARIVYKPIYQHYSDDNISNLKGMKLIFLDI
ncbi:hypothetical protein Avbf_01022 [Armadillidium vulgare]|nr:hypothetical protein Avbf_01022 [Armadillidium vulgare]